jgi:DNA polymerase III subunit epsilon
MRWLTWLKRGRTNQLDQPTRWIVIDLETSGLDPKTDRILAIGAIAIEHGRVKLDDSFEAIVFQTQVSDVSNILIHGITGQTQKNGRPMQDVIDDFEQWRAGAPIAGWHIGFDAAFLEPVYARLNHSPLPHASLDVAQLATCLLGTKFSDLDACARAFSIPIHARHHAAMDAWITALVLVRLITVAKVKGAQGFQALRSLTRQSRWFSH